MTPKERDWIKSEIRRLKHEADIAEGDGDYDVAEAKRREAAAWEIQLLKEIEAK